MTEERGDIDGSEVHQDNSRDTSDIGGPFRSYSSKGVAQGSRHRHILTGSNVKQRMNQRRTLDIRWGRERN
eukprot:4548942-Ditylum_brightwellii.AAC.1